MARRIAATAADKRLEKRACFTSHLIPYADADETDFRHHAWGNLRKRVRDTLVACGANDFQLNRFDECGSECLVEWSTTEDRYRLKANYCHCRHCRPCAQARANLLALNLRNKLADANDASFEYRFITLTLKHTHTPLAEQLRRLYACFSKLRKTPLWKKSQTGGTAVLECKWDPLTRMWHPHLHIVGQGHFMRQEQLSREWHRVTGDSRIVDIRQLKSGKDAAHYVSKYMSKGTTDDVWADPDAAQEWVTATKGLRSATTYGTWRGFQLMKPNTANDATDWQPVCLLRDLCRRVREGDEHATRLLQVLWDSLTYDPSRKRQKRETTQPLIL